MSEEETVLTANEIARAHTVADLMILTGLLYGIESERVRNAVDDIVDTANAEMFGAQEEPS